MTINHRHVLIHERQGNRPRMSLSAKGLDFIKDYESLRLTPYLDQVGHATIGYGHKIQPDEDYSKGVTQSQAEALLEKDVQASVEAVNSALERPVTQNEFDALVSFPYNVGPRAFRRSTLHAKIAHDQPITERDFTEYHYAAGRPSRGLLNRRIDEYNLFSGGGRQ